MGIKSDKALAILSLLLITSLAIASYYGAFVSNTYARDSVTMGTQGSGQDMFDLFFVVPLLVIARVLALKGKLLAWFVYSGSVFYVLYSFFIYTFGVHFNNLFLIYCLVLGSALYSMLLLIARLQAMKLAERFDEQTPVRAIGIYFIVVAVMFYLLWLKEVVPAILTSTVPASVSDNDLLVNPVHALDIAIALPGLFLTALLLMKRHALGLIFTPIFLIFTILLALALIAMVIAMKSKGISEDLTIAWIFLGLAIISSIFLYLFFKHMK